MGTAHEAELGREQPTSATIEAARAQGLEVTADGKIGNVAGQGQLATDAYVKTLQFSIPAGSEAKKQCLGK